MDKIQLVQNQQSLTTVSDPLLPFFLNTVLATWQL